MSVPFIPDTATESLAARILAGCFDGLPEHYSNEEWTKAAQEALDCENEAALLRMVEEARLHELHDAWQRDPRNEREADRRQFVGIEEGPFAYDYDKLTRAPLSSFADIGEGARHPLQSVEGMAA